MGTVADPTDPLAVEGKTGIAHFGQTAGALSGAGAGQIDWNKTGWNTPPDNMYSFQVGSGAGWLDPTTGRITYGVRNTQEMGDSKLTNNLFQGVGNTSQYQFDIGTDYGLGSTALGIIPMQHDATGQVSQYVTQTAGGGYGSFTTLAEAQQARDEYLAWKPTTKEGQAAAAAAPPTTTTTTTTPAVPTPTYNDLSLPGASETNWNETKDLYRQPTNAQKYLDSLAPPGTTNAQKVFDETPNQPFNRSANGIAVGTRRALRAGARLMASRWASMLTVRRMS